MTTHVLPCSEPRRHDQIRVDVLQVVQLESGQDIGVGRNNSCTIWTFIFLKIDDQNAQTQTTVGAGEKEAKERLTRGEECDHTSCSCGINPMSHE